MSPRDCAIRRPEHGRHALAQSSVAVARLHCSHVKREVASAGGTVERVRLVVDNSRGRRDRAIVPGTVRMMAIERHALLSDGAAVAKGQALDVRAPSNSA